jgi:hypothetical protein
MRTALHRFLTLTLLATLAGCDPGETVDDDSALADDDDTGDPGDPYAGIAMRADGWLRGDLHMHTTWSDGYEDVETVIALAEYYGHADFLAHHPEFEGNALDFIAITDHNDVSSIADPGWVSEPLLLIPGEEYSTNGHANRFGISEHVSTDPDGDGTHLDDIEYAIDAAHAEGGLFSPNHPMIDGIPWMWDTRTHDGLEVWNMGWALGSMATTEQQLADWEAICGAGRPFGRRAVLDGGRGSSGQSLTMYEAMVARGVHTAVLGGSDRHALVLQGTPTTYVRVVDGTDAAVDDVIEGIGARHTFVSRNPAAAQVLVEVMVDGTSYEAGDEIAIPYAGASAEITIRVGRASGGELRLIVGGAVTDDVTLETTPLGDVVLTEAIEGYDATFTLTLDVLPGDYLYPVVLEPLVPAHATAEQADMIREMADAAATSGEDYAEIAEALGPALDVNLLGDPGSCDPEDWEPDMLQCVSIITDGLGCFFVPDLLDRAMHAYTEDGAITDWTMGAIASAVRFTTES